MNFHELEKPKFTLNLQQLKVVHHVYEGKDSFGKSQIWNVIILLNAVVSISLLLNLHSTICIIAKQ